LKLSGNQLDIKHSNGYKYNHIYITMIVDIKKADKHANPLTIHEYKENYTAAILDQCSACGKDLYKTNSLRCPYIVNNGKGNKRCGKLLCTNDTCQARHNKVYLIVDEQQHKTQSTGCQKMKKMNLETPITSNESVCH
jgi:hypothetical protein